MWLDFQGMVPGLLRHATWLDFQVWCLPSRAMLFDWIPKHDVCSLEPCYVAGIPWYGAWSLRACYVARFPGYGGLSLEACYVAGFSGMVAGL